MAKIRVELKVPFECEFCKFYNIKEHWCYIFQREIKNPFSRIEECRKAEVNKINGKIDIL